MRTALLYLLLLSISSPSLAHNHSKTPYADFHARQIKALSDDQITDLKKGRGASLALAAELNGYPGPVHVLELGDQLELTAAQRSAMEGLVTAMRAEAIALGEMLIAQEAALDHQFANRKITASALADLTQNIATTQGALRAVHLKYHLLAIEALTPIQVSQYAELRGYKSAPEKQHQAH